MKLYESPAGIPNRGVLPLLGSRLHSTLIYLLAPLVLAAPALAETSMPAAPDPVRRAELITLVRQDCGSCHGLTLKGGLGPALLPDALRDKPAASLQATILHGRPGTAMPPWQRFLTEAEAVWIVAQLQKGFPDEK
jgi:cytochrome c55X